MMPRAGLVVPFESRGFSGLVLAQGVSAKTEADGGKGRGGICADIPRRVGRDLTAGRLVGRIIVTKM